jgi:hypothetical protein
MAVDLFIKLAEPGPGAPGDASQPADAILQTEANGALWQMLLPWALGVAEPVGVDRAKWSIALRQAVHQLFPHRG